MPVIGFLSLSSLIPWTDNLTAFRRGLKETGYEEGRNVAVEYRWADGAQARVPGLAIDLVRRQVRVIVATGGPSVIRAAMEATRTIPIIFTSGSDPVAQGFVASLNRPNANATGVTLFTSPLTAKRVELLREIASKVTGIAFLVNPSNRNSVSNAQEVSSVVRSLGLEPLMVNASSQRDLEVGIQHLGRQRQVALVIVADPFFESQRAVIVALAARHGVPAIYPWREDAQAGGLMSYGTSITDMYRQAGTYTGKVLRGAKPADLPVLQPTRVDLVINRKSARALGLAIPQSLLVRADEVIE